MEFGRNWNYRNISLLSWIVVGFLVLGIVIHLGTIISTISDIQHLKTEGEGYIETIESENEYLFGEPDDVIIEGITEERSDSNIESMQKFVACFLFFFCSLYIFFIVIFLIWVHMANINAWALGARGMRFTPGWAVGYFLIPILNLVRPVQVMNEIWQASDPVDPPGTEINPRIWNTRVVLWWVFLIGSALVSATTTLFTRDDDMGNLDMYAPDIGATVGKQFAIFSVDIISSLLSIAAGVTLIFIVRRITRMQQEKYETHNILPY